MLIRIELMSKFCDTETDIFHRKNSEMANTTVIIRLPKTLEAKNCESKSAIYSAVPPANPK